MYWLMQEIDNAEGHLEHRTSGMFYADDGYVAGTDGPRVQTVLTHATALFKKGV